VRRSLLPITSAEGDDVVVNRASNRSRSIHIRKFVVFVVAVTTALAVRDAVGGSTGLLLGLAALAVTYIALWVVLRLPIRKTPRA
jgi:hypothetical protein